MGGVPGEPFVEAAAVDPLGVPGTLGDYVTDDRSPWKERWGGWFVTGKQVPAGHRSSASFANSGESEPLEWKLDAGAYLSANSDVVALMVFEHQPPLAGKVEGTSGFAARFAAAGPRDGYARLTREKPEANDGEVWPI